MPSPPPPSAPACPSPPAPPPGAPVRAPPLTTATFNLLSPCYKRLHTPAGLERREREGSYHTLWHARLVETLSFLTGLSPLPDILTLQEVWFHPDYLATLDRHLSPHYHIFLAQRPRNKQDGVATCISRHSMHTASPEKLLSTPLLPESDRVLLAVVVSPTPTTRLLVLNTHLTFPHHSADTRRSHRQAQSAALIAAQLVDDIMLSDARVRLVHTLLQGDFNADNHSLPASALRHAHFANCYAAPPSLQQHQTAAAAAAAAVAAAAAAAAERELEARPTTHFNHRGQAVFVDHVFLRSLYRHSAVAPEADGLSDPPPAAPQAQAPHAQAPLPASKHRRLPSALGIVDAPFDNDSAHCEGGDTKPCDKDKDSSAATTTTTATTATATTRAYCSPSYDMMLTPVATTIYPSNLPAHTWPDVADYSLSDHRPLSSHFRCDYANAT